LNLAIAVEVMAAVMPHDRRIRIRDGYGLHGPKRSGCSDSLMRNRMARLIDDQLGTDIALPGGSDAPQMSVAFAMLRVFGHCQIDEAVINHRRGDHSISSGFSTDAVGRVLGVPIELPEKLRFPVHSRIGSKAVQPAV